MIFRCWCLLIFGFTGSLCSIQHDPLSGYKKFLEAHADVVGSRGNYKEGEIEIVTDEKRIRSIEEMQRVRLKKKGFSEEESVQGSRVGIIAEDEYWIWIRDAVIFPTGAEGTFDRILKRSAIKAGVSGGAIVPILPDGKIVLNLNYRHATRCWQLEIPRGHANSKEKIEETVIRELREETGFNVTHVEKLGVVAPDSGCLSDVVPIYFGFVDKKGIPRPDFSEAILRTEAFTIAELKEGFVRGWVELDIKGKKEKIMLYDPFLAFALLQIEEKKILTVQK